MEIIEGENVSLQGKPAGITEELRTSVFVDIVHYYDKIQKIRTNNKI